MPAFSPGMYKTSVGGLTNSYESLDSHHLNSTGSIDIGIQLSATDKINCTDRINPLEPRLTDVRLDITKGNNDACVGSEPEHFTIEIKSRDGKVRKKEIEVLN